MASIFDEEDSREYRLAMISDGIASLARQWLLRRGTWKIPAALAGAFIQVWGCGLRTLAHDHWSQNTQALTPYVQQVIVISLGSLCILCVMVMSLTLWTMRFQRRELNGHRIHARQ